MTTWVSPEAGCNVQGLGDLYAADYVQAATGVGAEDKQEPIRKEARMLLKSLFARLDALSHFHYAPKPIIEDMRVRAEVPALAMEDVAPQVGPAFAFNVFFCFLFLAVFQYIIFSIPA